MEVLLLLHQYKRTYIVVCMYVFVILQYERISMYVPATKVPGTS
jgi:hypothetical protein